MKQQDRISVSTVGGASLLVIFAVLFLCVFSMLSVSMVLAEERLAEASAESVTAYYEADLQAQKIFARLRNGEQVPGVREEGECCFFFCEISEDQWLEVQLQRKGDLWMVLRWQAVAGAEENQDTLPVWSGT